MKINTDGVLLGALTEATNPQSILDIGTGTGVIALMLAQRFPDAMIEAVEIDSAAATTASANFKSSVFSERLSVYAGSFQGWFETHLNKKYDLIVSNPPFFIDSLKSDNTEKGLARHTDKKFFEELTSAVSLHLSDTGAFWVILPKEAAQLLKDLMIANGYEMSNITTVHSFIHSEPHRELLAFNKSGSPENFEKFVIYYKKKEYSLQYKNALKEFLTIF